MAELPTNSGSSMLSAIPQLLQLFVGTGKTTSGGSTTTSKNGNPNAIASLVSLLGSNAANPDAAGQVTNDATANAIKLMLQAGVPSIGSAERSSGVYNSSMTKDSMAQLEGQTAAAASKIQLDQMNQAAATRTSAASALNEMTGTTTQASSGTSKQAGAIDPMMGILALGGLMGANALFGGKKSGSQGQVGASINAVPDTNVPITTPNVNSIFDSLGFTGQFANDIAGALKSSTTGPDGSAQTGGLKDLTNAGIAVGENNLLGLIGSGLSGAGDYLNTAIGGAIGASDGKVSVICTRMHELGYMSDTTHLIDELYGAYVSKEKPALMRWYHSWAIPFVATCLHGETWVSRVLIQACRPLVSIWSAWMKYQFYKLAKLGAITHG